MWVVKDPLEREKEKHTYDPTRDNAIHDKSKKVHLYETTGLSGYGAGAREGTVKLAKASRDVSGTRRTTVARGNNLEKGTKHCYIRNTAKTGGIHHYSDVIPDNMSGKYSVVG